MQVRQVRLQALERQARRLEGELGTVSICAQHGTAVIEFGFGYDSDSGSVTLPRETPFSYQDDRAGYGSENETVSLQVEADAQQCEIYFRIHDTEVSIVMKLDRNSGEIEWYTTGSWRGVM